MRSSSTALQVFSRLTGGLLVGLLPTVVVAQTAPRSAAKSTAFPAREQAAAPRAAGAVSPVAQPSVKQSVVAPTKSTTPVALPRAAAPVGTKSLPVAATEAAAPRSPYEIRWTAPHRTRLENGKTLLLPAASDAPADPATGLPVYGVRLAGQRLASARLREARYEPLPAAEVALLNGVQLASEPVTRISIGTETRQPVSFVFLTPLRRNAATGAIERLVGFDLTTTAAPAPAARANTTRTYTSASVLNQGRWVKLGVTQSGIHRLDRGLLQSLGLDPGPDGRNVQIWGNGGRMLPQLNSIPRPDDLVENPILVEENNGAFAALSFYAEGPHGWNYQPSTGRYTHDQNLYSDTAFYFLTVGAQPGRRVATEGAPGVPSGAPITRFDEHYFYEREQTSLLKQGRDWVGEAFDSFTPSRDFDFTLEGLDPAAPARVTARMLAASSNVTSFAATVNGQALGTLSCPDVSGIQYTPIAAAAAATWSVPTGSVGADDRIRIKITYAPGNNSSTGYLDYLEINFQRELRRYGAQTIFRSAATVAPGTVRQYEVGNCDANSQIWDVTNPRAPRRQALTLNGSTATFTAAADSLREFVVFNPADARTEPRNFGVVAAQNLHAFNVNAAVNDQLDLVIVTHPQFLGQATRLADHRRRHDNLQVAVVTTTQVWNEFGSGRQDITAIRDLMRMVYDRTTDPIGHPLNLLIFGDASYDYKSNRWYNQRPGAPNPPTPDNTNFVPVYEARESLHPIYAFSSEDYYALMDDVEGLWSESGGILEMMDIGVGRLPARDDASATTLVDKLIRYDAATSFGRWRNRLLYVTDDADGGVYSSNAEELISRFVTPQAPAANTGKLYLDLFPQISVPSGQRSPTNARAIEEGIDQGALIVNYIGHGGETGWASERILDVPTINNWRNADRLTFMLTATCEFGRYDDPARSSGAEYAIYNGQGGAVGLFTTTRPVYNEDNLNLNKEFHNTVFGPATDGKPKRIGEVLRRTKANQFGSVLLSRNFTLLGDPSMRLAIPQLRATVTQINDQPVGTADTLRALTTVKLNGVIDTGTGTVVTTFNGRIQVTVYDKETVVRTLGDESTPTKAINIRESIIYDGLATVTNGLWTASFVVPRDIAYSYGTGKISLYAWSSDQDAAGANTTVTIGGSSTSTAQDRTPPEIKLFMDDRSFVMGGTTGTDATLLSDLSDESGINTAGTGIGHEITVILDGNRQNVLVMNPYYTADVDRFQSGKVLYLFKGLAAGPHSLTLKAWDTFNNSAERTLDFVVENNQGLALDHVLNYPNPFANHTTFHFDHNRQGDDLDVQVQLFTVAGRLIRTLQTRTTAATAHVQELSWDGRDEYGDVLARGVYIYKVNVRSARDGSHTSKYEKLVILN